MHPHNIIRNSVWNRFMGCPRTVAITMSKDVGNSSLGAPHKLLLRRAVADLPSCYCRIAWSYAKEKSGLRFRPVRDTYIGHVSNSVGMSNRIPWSCSTGSLGHVSNSATFQLGQFESIGHVSGHVRGHVQNHFLKFFYVFFERFLKSVKCDWYMPLGPQKRPRKSVFRNL